MAVLHYLPNHQDGAVAVLFSGIGCLRNALPNHANTAEDGDLALAIELVDRASDIEVQASIGEFLQPSPRFLHLGAFCKTS